MTANPNSIDLSAFVSEHLERAEPDLLRSMLRARERYKVASVKDDRLDAFVLADTLRHEHQ